MSQPSTIDLSPKDKALVRSIFGNLNVVIGMVSISSAYAYMSIGPVLFFPVFECVSIVKLTINLQVVPHSDEMESMVGRV